MFFSALARTSASMAALFGLWDKVYYLYCARQPADERFLRRCGDKPSCKGAYLSCLSRCGMNGVQFYRAAMPSAVSLLTQMSHPRSPWIHFRVRRALTGFQLGFTPYGL